MLDYLKSWFFLINEGIIPPFCVELVLKDSSKYFLHSIAGKDEDTRSMVMRIWDLRALTDDDLEVMRKNLNKINSRKDLSDTIKVHPNIDWANLRIHVDDILYCIEWHDRLWPDDQRPSIGFNQESN